MSHRLEFPASRNGERHGKGVFTRYVRALDPHGEPPDAESFNRVWEALRSVLARELRRRGLWGLAPHYLGLYGWRRWTEASDSNSPRRSSDALDELTADGYAFIFIDRIASLRAHARVKPNVEGLVFLNVRHFIHELQRRHDPLGARVFLLLKTAAREMVEAGILRVTGGEKRIGSSTLLAFRTASADARAAAESELQPLIERWGDHLLPGLVTTRGKGHPKLVAQVREHVLSLEGQGASAFILGTLVGLLKLDVRRRWTAILDQAGGEKAVEASADGEATLVSLVPPDTGFEGRQSFRRLVDCTARELAALPEDERTRNELEALWEVLVDRAAESKEPAAFKERTTAASGDRKMPSRREMARLLGIPRDRLPRLYEILSGIVSRCHEANLRPTKVATELSPSPAGDRMDSQQLREHLRQATGQAVARSTRAREEALAPSRAGSRPGEIFVLRASTAVPVEWLVIEDDPEDPERCLVIPADTNPLAGPDDVVVPADVPGGPLTLRCALGCSLPTALLEAELCSRRLAPSYLEQARAKVRSLQSKMPGPRRGTDVDPAYQDWIGEVTATVQEATAAGKSLARTPPPLPFRKPGPPQRRLRWTQGMAAALAFLSLGLSGLVWVQRRQLARQAEPYVEPPSKEIVFQDDPARGPEIWNLPRADKPMLLDLVFRELPSCELLRVEFFDSRGHLLWATEDFDRPPTAEIRLVLPSLFLSRGPAELHLLGRCKGMEKLLDKRSLRIEWR